MRKLQIETCPKLKVLEGFCALERLVLEDYAMETLPEYMRDVNPRHFELRCDMGEFGEQRTDETGVGYVVEAMLLSGLGLLALAAVFTLGCKFLKKLTGL